MKSRIASLANFLTSGSTWASLKRWALECWEWKFGPPFAFLPCTPDVVHEHLIGSESELWHSIVWLSNLPQLQELTIVYLLELQNKPEPLFLILASAATTSRSSRLCPELQGPRPCHQIKGERKAYHSTINIAFRIDYAGLLIFWTRGQVEWQKEDENPWLTHSW